VDDDYRQAWAQFRFEVIAPLLDERLDKAERARLRAEILRRSYTRPDGKEWYASERTLRNWLQRYASGELSGLENRCHGARGRMKALDENVLEAARGLRERMRSRSIQDIMMHLKYASSVDISTISASTLNRHLNRIGATKGKSYSELGAFQRFQMEHINQVWQSDCSDGIYLPDPLGLKEVRQTTLVTFIDDASRFCVHGEFYWTERLSDLLDCFRTALIARGQPARVYCDNGPVYIAQDFASICAALGIGLRHSEAYHPEGKGKQERYYLTIQRRFYREAERAGLATLAELNEFFWAWLDECYHKVKHTALKVTPLERWQMEESLVKRLSLEQIHQALQLRARRTVNKKTALIQLEGRLYQASRELAGKRVHVRWPFDDESAVNIWLDGSFQEQAELFIPGADIDYSKRPVRPVKDETPKVLDCSKRLCTALVATFRGQNAPQDTSRYGVLTEREFIFVVEQCLGKSLTAPENATLTQVYKSLYPVNVEFVERCLAKAIACRGNRMHITFYVKRMLQLRNNGGNCHG
jgi:putative transposase